MALNLRRLTRVRDAAEARAQRRARSSKPDPLASMAGDQA